MRIILVVAAALLVTLPFGFYRAYTRTYSLRWFLAIHVPVALVFLIRYEAHVPWAYLPLTALAFAVGQILGSRAGRRWIKRRSIASVAREQKVPLPRGCSDKP